VKTETLWGKMLRLIRPEDYEEIPVLALNPEPISSLFRCRFQSAHVRQSRSDSVLGFQAKVITTFRFVFLCSEAVPGIHLALC